ncbi:MAG: hypothetical protein QOE92_54 [Chloroflexota bacterium]|jgi:hypothetical protein|nr:hypothetical protein [Chloroflexota bacterium]
MSHLAITAGVAVVCSVGGAGLAATQALIVASAEVTTTIAVSGHLNALTDVVPDRSLCDAQGGAFAPGPTDAFYSGTSTLTGTFEGTGRFCGRTSDGVIRQDGNVPFLETDLFTGTVQGCGKGSVTYTVNGTVGAKPMVATQGLPTDEDWQIVARSGIAGLSGLVSGGGHDVGQINADSSIDTDFTGAVQCTAPAGTAAEGDSSSSPGMPRSGALPSTGAASGEVLLLSIAMVSLAITGVAVATRSRNRLRRVRGSAFHSG